MFTLHFPAERGASAVERALYALNSALVFWFFAFLITGPKQTLATTALLLLGLLSLPVTLRMAPRIWAQSAPWLLGLGAYCALQIVYRLIDGGLDARLDPPARYLGAIPILFHLSRFGFGMGALWAGLAAGCVLSGAVGAYEVLIEGLPRAGAGHHPIAYGSLLALLTVSTLHGASLARTTPWRIILGVSALAGLAGVLLSGTRGLYLPLLGCIAFIGYRQLKTCAVPTRKIALAAAASLTLAMVAASQVPAVQNRFEESKADYAQISRGNLDNSFGHRLQMWHAGLFIISQEPLLGIGPDVHKRQAFARAFMEENRYGSFVLSQYDHLHNLYINELASFGLVGLVALGGLLFGALVRTSAPTRDLIVLALIIILLEGLTETVLSHHRLALAFVMLATLARAQQVATASQR